MLLGSFILLSYKQSLLLLRLRGRILSMTNCEKRRTVSSPKMNECQKQLLRNLRKKYGMSKTKRTQPLDLPMNGSDSPRRNGATTPLSGRRIRSSST